MTSRPMKALIAAAFGLMLLGPSRPAYSQLTEQDSKFLDSCSENITRKIYSPTKAENCLIGLDENDHALLDRAKSYKEVELSRLMAYMNALKDLGDFYKDAEDEYVIKQGLLVRLEATPCVLCRLELGPQPDKLYKWIDIYAQKKLPDTKKAAMDWDGLTPPAPEQLAARGQSRDAWAGLTISERQSELEAWATEKFDEMLPPGAKGLDTDKYFPTLKAIWPYLTEAQRTRMNEVLNGMKETMAAAKKAAEAGGKKSGALEKKYEALTQKVQGLNASPGGAAGFLNGAFDNSRAGTDTPGPASAKTPAGGSYTLTDAQAAKLSPRVQQALLGPKGELADTAIGKEAIAFTNAPGGELKFSVARLDSDNTRGVFYPSKSEVKVNLTYLETAMRKTGVTADQLMDEKNTDALKKVSRYVAPTFVHEYDGHQKQTAWADSKNIPDHYYIGQETEAFSKGSLFVLQKAQAEQKKGNPYYSTQIAESDVDKAKLLKAEGTAGVGRSVMYYKVPSREGVAAKTFAEYEDLKKELTLRQLAASKNPEEEARIDAARGYGKTTAELNKKYNAIYPWYKESMKKSAEEAKYFQKAIKDLDGEEKSDFVMPGMGG
ncbi:MAG: hypothetical protein PHV36_11985 [Elusimicrobiales bacterium]|nr:hypothetical protein [Elusimicrobiales bacterium]